MAVSRSKRAVPRLVAAAVGAGALALAMPVAGAAGGSNGFPISGSEAATGGPPRATTWTLTRVVSDPRGVAPLYPAGAAVAADGTVYVASSGSDDVVRVASDGSLHPLSIPGLDRPRDIAIDVAGRLLILDTTDNELVIATSAGSVVKTLRPGLKSPFGVSSDATGIYVADTYHHRVLKLDPNTGAKRWEQSVCSGAFSRPRDVVVGSDGGIYVADTDHNRIAVLDPATGSCRRSFGSGGGGNGQYRGPRSIASDGHGGLYVAESFGRRVQHVSNTGSFIATSAPNSPSLRAPACVYATSDRIGLCDTFEYAIRTYAESGTAITPTGSIAGPRPVGGGFNEPFGVAFGGDGAMYVTDMFNHRVEKFAPNGAFEREWGGFGTAPTSFTFPRGITVAPSGQVVVTDSENDRISFFQPTGALVRSIRAKGNRTGWPHQSAIAPDGTLWLADTYKNRVLHLDTSGVVLGEFNGGGSINTPRGIAVDSAGMIYVANSGRSTIEKYTPSGTRVAVLATAGTGPTNVRLPWNLVIAPGVGGTPWLYIADGNNNRVVVMTTSGAAVGIIGTGGSAPGNFKSPRAVAVDPVTGTVAITDFYGYDVTLWKR